MNTTPLDADTFRKLPLFRALSTPTREHLAAASSLRSCERNAVLFQQGDPAEHLFGLLSGSVRLYRAGQNGREQVVKDIQPAITFAEAAIFDFGRYPVAARTIVDETILLAVPTKVLLAVLREDEAASRAMLSALCCKLHELVDRVEILSVPDASRRLARFLLRLPVRGEQDAYRVAWPAPKKDLATELAMTPETLSRVLKRWREEGWAHDHANELWFDNLDALEDLAGSD